ncbi:hypothetical protein PIB30_009449 [Stylosanthes scabra]|uniref:Ubiquitin-like protease family profile domain-containing protein n=1 Tax=Stylosanthes scabra TaxID=79078 RepID=A0ABU6X4Q5_9FABA|nr:hypothetical protein [Stylosanthes scabra]
MVTPQCRIHSSSSFGTSNPASSFALLQFTVPTILHTIPLSAFLINASRVMMPQESIIVDEVPPKSSILHEEMIRLHELLDQEAISKLVRLVVLEELHQFSPLMVQPHALTPVIDGGGLKLSYITTPVRGPLPTSLDKSSRSSSLPMRETHCQTRSKSSKYKDKDPNYELKEDKEGSNTLACRKRKQFWVKKGRKKPRSTIKAMDRKLFVRDEAKLDRGRPWLYHSDISPFMDGEEMPRCLDLSFRPSKGMKFVGDELAIREQEGPVNSCSMKATCWRCSYSSCINDVEGNIWARHSSGTLEYIRATYMSATDPIIKIYVPIHVEGHWFLMVIDRFYERVAYLDSLKCERFLPSQIDAMEAVAKLLDSILGTESFHKLPTKATKSITMYDFDEPKVPRQNNDSNDCGVFVAQ